MKITYCDLCEQPIKNNKSYYFIILENSDKKIKEINLNDIANYYNYLDSTWKYKEFEVCDDCKNIFEYIFTKRKLFLNNMAKEIEAMMNKDIKNSVEYKKREKGK